VISQQQRQEAAQALANAERTRVPIPPLTATYPFLDVTDAYEIQLLAARGRLAAGGRVRGHKVGLSSRAMQKMLGVDEPDYGQLFDDMFVLEGSAVPAARWCAPRIEPEVAFVLRSPLAGPGVTVADALRAVEFVVPALEIIDSRVRDWQIRLPDTIADNASSAAVVLGGVATPLAGLDLRTIGCVLRMNGEVVETGAAGAVLGNPVTALAWLANKVAGGGVTLEAGQVVLPGSCTRAVPVTAGDTVWADFDGLGSVSVTFTGGRP
jgi:2-keto-4-pentenoate hydratase